MTRKKKSPTGSTNVVAEARAGRTGRTGRKRSRGGGSGGGSSTRENIKSFAWALLVFLVLRSFFVEAYHIPSGSMIPTLLVGDWLFVNKLVYGPNIPFTNVHLPGYSSPHRGDVVVFESPYQSDEAALGQDPTPTLVKRLIGMPGDTLYMRAGVLYINGVAQHRDGLEGFSDDPSQNRPTDTSPLFIWQKQIALYNTRFGSAPDAPTHDDWGPLLIPPAHYFMMGDNRYCSKDSRYWGVVPKANVRGSPLFVYYSHRPSPSGLTGCDGETSIRPLPLLTDIRWGRLGHIIR